MSLVAAQLSGPWLLVAGAAAVVWLVGAALVWSTHRVPDVEPEPSAGTELPAEPPWVAGLLADDFVVPRELAPAILLDLAARGVVRLEEVQPGRTICRLGGRSDAPLSAAERQVLDEIAERAIDGVVPADALTTGVDEMSRRWHRALQRHVVEDCQRRGLTRDRWSPKIVRGLAVALFLIAAPLWLATRTESELSGDAIPAAVAGALAVAVLVGGVLTCMRLQQSLAQLPTRAGIAAAARVRGFEGRLGADDAFRDLPPAAVIVRGPYLAYAAAFGLAPRAVDLLPFGTEDDHRAWSRFGGRWRRVRVRYPRLWPPGWGVHPVVTTLVAVGAAGLSLLAIDFLLGLADDARPAGFSQHAWDWTGRALLGLGAVAGGVLVGAVIVLVRAVPDCAQRRTVTGELVRRRRFEGWSSSGDQRRYRYYVAVDDGSAERIVAWRVRESLWQNTIQGETVAADVTPRLGYVRTLARARSD